MNKIVINCQPSYLNSIKELGYDYIIQDNNEIDVIVEDVEYLDGNHPSKNGIWEDPDEQLCEHYQINYDFVNCIEVA